MIDAQTSDTGGTLAYAAFEKRPSNGRVLAAWGLLVGGLGLIGLGGCFLIGVLLTLFSTPLGAPPAAGASGAGTLLLATLYLLAFACFGGAVLLLVSGVGSLITISRS